MAPSLLCGPDYLNLIFGFPKNGLVVHHRHVQKKAFSCSPCYIRIATPKTLLPRCSLSSSRPVSQPRFIQHKQEAIWFYRFLSIAYDQIWNPPHWTEDMREDALEPVDLHSRNLKVVDVGGGTGFATLGIVKHVDANNVTIIDQSPHQLAKARQKEPLKECTILEGDAEDIPFPTDHFDRYVSAKEEEYIEWFHKAGFKDVKLKRIGPKWYRGVRRYGLIIGCSVTGVKPFSGDSPLQLGPKAEDVKKQVSPFVVLTRFILGTLAGAYYMLIPVYMWLKDLIVPKGMPI